MAKLIEQIKAVQQLINCGGLENASVSFDCQSDRLRLRVELKEAALTHGSKAGISVSKGLFYLEDIDLDLPPQEMLMKATVRVESLVVRVAAGLVNRALTSPQAKQALAALPVDIRDLQLAMSGQLMTISGQVHKLVTMGFSVDLKPYVKGNNVCIAFAGFYLSNLLPMPGSLRRMLMSVVGQKLTGDPRLKGLVSIDGDVVTVNPWKKLPLKVKAEIKRFSVEGHNLVIALGSAPAAAKGKNASPVASGKTTPGAESPAQAKVATSAPQPVAPASSDASEMVLPYV